MRSRHGETIDHLPVDHLLRVLALDEPERVAVVGEDWFVDCWSLDDAVDFMARALGATGLGPDDRVGVDVEAAYERLVTEIALLRLGAVPTRLGTATADGGRRDRGLDFLVTHAGNGCRRHHGLPEAHDLHTVPDAPDFRVVPCHAPSPDEEFTPRTTDVAEHPGQPEHPEQSEQQLLGRLLAALEGGTSLSLPEKSPPGVEECEQIRLTPP